MTKLTRQNKIKPAGNLAGANFEGANMAGVDITDLYLIGADLAGANFEGSILEVEAKPNESILTQSKESRVEFILSQLANKKIMKPRFWERFLPFIPSIICLGFALRFSMKCLPYSFPRSIFGTVKIRLRKTSFSLWTSWTAFSCNNSYGG